MNGGLKRFLQHVLGFTVFVVFVAGGFSFGYWVVGLFGLQLPDYAYHMVVVAASFMIMGLFGMLLHLVARSRNRHTFMEIVDALRNIARGNFDVYLDFGGQKGHPFTEIVDNFNHMAKQLKEMEEMRQEFISNVSHEIQSPLTSIGGFARALQDEGLTVEERRHYLGIIETESHRLSKLSDNLMKLTSLESEHHPFERVEYRLDQQIRTIVLACEPHWMEKELEMDVSLAKVTVCGDQDLMSQVWMNLIHNSIKFTPVGGRIHVVLEVSDDGVAVVRISDTGIGIAEDELVHVFERFYKSDHARERSKGGSGLGLSIAEKIVEMHGGTIGVESELGKGATFVVSLPLGAE